MIACQTCMRQQWARVCVRMRGQSTRPVICGGWHRQWLYSAYVCMLGMHGMIQRKSPLPRYMPYLASSSIFWGAVL